VNIWNRETQRHERFCRVRKIKLLHLVRKGLTADEIAARLGFTADAVRKFVSDAGLAIVPGRRRVKLPFGVTEKDVDELGADEVVGCAEASA